MIGGGGNQRFSGVDRDEDTLSSDHRQHAAPEDQQLVGDDVLCAVVHGDAAFSGQGINQESLMLAYLPHFSVGGTIHLVVNNQVGFTTTAAESRSSFYATDAAKAIQVPIVHVNGDDPEALARAARFASTSSSV